MDNLASTCERHFRFDDFDESRLETNQCPVRDCNADLVDVSFRKTKRPWCPTHGIRLHPDTFVYWNGPGLSDTARLRNFIVRRDLARAIALPDGLKVEAHRLGYEMSEDALSWNVFVSLAVAGELRKAAQVLTERTVSKEPTLYLWGHRVDLRDSDHSLYAPLQRVRKSLENDIHTFVTEPDIMLVVDGEMVICIEAKFGSANPLAYDSPSKDGEKPTSREGLLQRYLGEQSGSRTNNIIQVDRIGPHPRSQLLRNVVFAYAMAAGAAWHVVNLVSATQGVGRDDKRKSYADPSDEVKGYLHREWQHCFTFKTWENLHALVVKDDSELTALDEYFRGKSAHYRRAFELK